MARWVKNNPCPECGSKDNLGVWDDGSEWCWGCHYYKPPDTIKTFQSRHDKKAAYIKCITLPDDTVELIPKAAVDWLGKYNLTDKEFATLSPMYSYEKELLIFPVYGPGKVLLMYQGRYFGENPKHPKYLTYGAKDILHIVGEPNETIVVTEDLISAVKVGTVINAMPLWGSSLSQEAIKRLSSRFSHLIIWLDKDKARESLRTRLKASPFFDEVQCVVTELDPKEYSNEEIAKFLEI